MNNTQNRYFMSIFHNMTKNKISGSIKKSSSIVDVLIKNIVRLRLYNIRNIYE